MLRTATLIFAIALGLSINISDVLAKGPLEIQIQKRNSVLLSVHGKPALAKQTDGDVDESIIGSEMTCGQASNDDGTRSSLSKGIVRTEAHETEEGELISIDMSSEVYSNGGSYRKCVHCTSEKICVGILPADTTASAKATASAIVTLRHSSDFPRRDYHLRVSSFSDGVARPTIKVVGPSNTPLPLPQNFDDPILIPGKPGTIFYIHVALTSESKDKGHCCEDHKKSSGRIDLSLLRAPQLEAAGEMQPFIAGGEPTDGHKNVGAILINGRLHCTGSVIGQSTILTAAHCLYGYESQLKKFSFILGSDLTDPEAGPVSVSGLIYPQDHAAGFYFNEKTLEDDIGLVFLAQKLSVEPVRIFEGPEPTWDEILRKPWRLTFVGFGYDVVENKRTGAGVKREATWRINRVENRRISFKLQGKNTCKGDSGGPAFLTKDRLFFQAAVTSGGNSACTEGFNTRIDAYKSWLDGKIR